MSSGCPLDPYRGWQRGASPRPRDVPRFSLRQPETSQWISAPKRKGKWTQPAGPQATTRQAVASLQGELWALSLRLLLCGCNQAPNRQSPALLSQRGRTYCAHTATDSGFHRSTRPQSGRPQCDFVATGGQGAHTHTTQICSHRHRHTACTHIYTHAHHTYILTGTNTPTNTSLARTTHPEAQLHTHTSHITPKTSHASPQHTNTHIQK